MLVHSANVASATKEGRTQVVTRSFFTLPGEGRLGGLEPHELAVKLFKNLMAKAGADVADVPPTIVFSQCQHKGAEEGPGSPRRREAGDHDLLPLRGLHLQPIGSPACGCVRAVGALGRDAFEMSQLGLCKELCAAAFAVVAEAMSLWRGRRALSRFLRSRSGSARRSSPAANMRSNAQYKSLAS